MARSVRTEDLPISEFQQLLLKALSLEGFEEELLGAETGPDDAGWIGGLPEPEDDVGGLGDDGYQPPRTPSDSEEEEEEGRLSEEDEPRTGDGDEGAGGPAGVQVRFASSHSPPTLIPTLTNSSRPDPYFLGYVPY